MPMTDTSLTVNKIASRFDFKKIFTLIFHPGQGMESVAEAEKSIWLIPMLLISIMFLIRTFVSGYFQAHAAAMGQVALPVDWQYWSPQMQNNYMQARQATQGPVFVYVIPAALGLLKFWLGWLIVAGLTHLTSTLLGGRGKMGSAMNVVAWACLPFAIRDIVRIIFMLVARHAIASPGFSGLVAIPFLSTLLASVDIFLVWFAILLVLGVKKADNLPVSKAAGSVVIALLVVLLAQAGLGTLTSKLGGMIITRPF
jgi:hypothetical protein